MKILSITLSDVRRFTSPMTVAGLGSGVNVLTAPNESGKSTLFDALQAVFFAPHRSRTREIKALQPHAGGKPTVSVEIELAAGRYRITKRWLSGVMAEVREGSRLVAKGDAAEDWIQAQLKADDAGGPAGLLWVRQGVTALDSDAGRAADAARSARRDLLSSVAGEVEAMTGGRRMDRALARCTAELADLVTATGRARAGGPLKAAEDDVVDLETREAELATLSRDLAKAITERRGLRREAEELRDPAVAAKAEADRDTARDVLDAARGHAETLAKAEERVETARRSVEHAAERRDALARLIGARDAALRQLNAARGDEAAAAETEDARIGELAKAEARLTSARDALIAAEGQLARAIAAETAERDRKRRKQLDAQLETAREHAEVIASVAVDARKGPDAATMERLEQAHQDLRVQEALREQAALSVTMYYASEAAAPVRLSDGTALDEATPRALPDGDALDFDGIGRLTIAPGARAADGGDYEDARTGFDRALTAAGAATLDEARRNAKARQRAEETLKEARAALGGVAPEGIDALEAERAALGDPDADAAATAQDLPDRTTAERAVEAARRAAEEAVAQARQMTEAAQAAKVAHAKAGAQLEAAESKLSEAEEALAGFELEAETGARAAAVTAAETALAQATQDAARLAADAPDFDAAEAAFKRAQSAVDATTERLRTIDRRLAELDTLIALRAGEGVDEDLAEVRDRLDDARARLARYTFERDTLTLLQAELEAARISAREHYFEPVTRELRPLLHVLWPDAELTFDDETILPTALTRDGQEESLEALSGGTREQIALLVRLAFARLLASSGRAAPVILDDALVYTDDDRIERMFDTLHRQAGDMQLIVFSCRQRAFRALGGKVLGFEPGALPEEVDA